MKRHARRLQGKAGLELLEEAFHLLRSAPAATLALYYTGTLPFVLALLWFWADMSHSPFAYQHLDAAALGLAALFLWMKCWQAVYARALRAAVAGGLPPLSPGAVWRIIVTQAALQPTGLLIWPLALVPVLPFPYVFAFYQNLTALADGEPGALGAQVRRAMRQTSLQARQNLVLLLVLLGFGFIVFLNWTTFCLSLPALAKMLFGLESVFSRSSATLLNTTFFATMFGLTYLSLDPLVKAAYALRCFYGESLQSGADLKSELRRLVPAGAVLPLALGFVLAVAGTTARASEGNGGEKCCQPAKLLELRLVGKRDESVETTGRFFRREPAIKAEGRDLNRTARSPAARESASGLPALSKVVGRSKSGSKLHALHTLRDVPEEPGCSQAVGRSFGPGFENSLIQPLSDLFRPASREDFGFLISVSAAALETAGAEQMSRPDPTTLKQSSSKAAAPALSAPELDRAIQEVVRQDKYTWRMPREKIAEPETGEQGIIARFFERVGELVARGLKAFWHGLENLLRKLFQGQNRTRHSTSGYGWIMLLQILPYLLIAAAAAGLGFLLYRLWLSRYRPPSAVAGEPIQPAPDLADENVGADQMPEDGWTRLARELLARGELRLAMRAFYLASLAHLSERNLISLARFKSNRDYERELSRRGHAFPGLLDLFGENVAVFECIWYGMHEVSVDLVTRFATNVERIRGGDAPPVRGAAGT